MIHAAVNDNDQIKHLHKDLHLKFYHRNIEQGSPKWPEINKFLCFVTSNGNLDSDERNIFIFVINTQNKYQLNQKNVLVVSFLKLNLIKDCVVNLNHYVVFLV